MQVPRPRLPLGLQVRLDNGRCGLRPARCAALQAPHERLVREALLGEEPRHLVRDVLPVETAGVLRREPDSRRTRGNGVVDGVEPLGADELREAVGERLVEGVAATVVHRDFDCGVLVHDQRVIEPGEDADLLRHRGEVEFSLGHFPEEAHAAPTGACEVECTHGGEDLVDLALVVSEDGAHVEIDDGVVRYERIVEPCLGNIVFGGGAGGDWDAALHACTDEDYLVEGCLLPEIDIGADDRFLVRPGGVELGEGGGVDRFGNGRQFEDVEAVLAQGHEGGVVDHAGNEVGKEPYVEEFGFEGEGSFEVRARERF